MWVPGCAAGLRAGLSPPLHAPRLTLQLALLTGIPKGIFLKVPLISFLYHVEASCAHALTRKTRWGLGATAGAKVWERQREAAKVHREGPGLGCWGKELGFVLRIWK